MKIHFIAIGGSIMHNLAIVLKQNGHAVTGSDDEIFEPSLSKLKNADLLPESYGWFPEKISADTDAVILGMHARSDNPELQKARQLGLKVYSMPEFLYEHAKNKQRVVVAGSHGKTTVTSMIMHVLQQCNKQFDYIVGATLHGFDATVRLSDDAPIMILEGDEYTTSPEDLTPKFLHYKQHIGVITGIAWDHINVFPNYDDYVQQFAKFIAASPKAGALIYNQDDKVLSKLVKNTKMRDDVTVVPYTKHKARVKDGETQISVEEHYVNIPFFGEHNLYNMNAALNVCLRLGISKEAFYRAIVSFKGAARRLELVGQNAVTRFYRDFAHAPSKLKATVNALKQQYKKQHLVACIELHTYSSLNKAFINQYKGTFDEADTAIVYYNPKTVAHKRLELFSEAEVLQAFGRKDIKVFTDSAELANYLRKINWAGKNLLLMSSGNYDNLDLNALKQTVVG